MLGLRYSTSISKIKKILSAIDSQDVDYLVNPNKFLSSHSIEDIEGNRIIILKEIGVNVIKEGDWVLPQKILVGVYALVPHSLKEDCSVAETQNAIFALDL